MTGVIHTSEQDVNMASKRVISVNEASLVDLKAELYRQETQFKREKVDSSKLPKKAPIWQRKKKESKKNIEKSGKNVEEPPADSSYDNALEKSRLMLEAKSALYEKLSTGEIEVPSDEDDQEGRFLVDFLQKTNPKEKDEDKIDNSSEMTHSASSADEWVDYVDSFGRSRKCLRQDLPIMKEKDEKSKENSNQDTSLLTLLSDDMRREIIRKKWEKEVEETLDKPVGPVHYQDVLSNETRDHGVGYYQFSKVEEERQEQQTTLKKLRAQTEQQRSKREKLLEKRKAAMDACLAKVRDRKLKKLNEQGLASTADIKEDSPVPGEIISEEDEKIKGEQETSSSKDENDILTDDNEDRIKNKIARMENSHSNKWEKSKINLEVFDKPKPKIIPKQDPRNERNPDFAPPYTVNENEKRNFEKKDKWKDIDSGFKEDNTTNNTNKLWESQSTEHDPALTSYSSTNYDSYAQETPSSTNVPQVPPCQPPPILPYQPPTNILPNILPNLLPPPTHTFPPPLYPPQFPTYCNDYTNNIPYPPPPPGVLYYPPVPPPGYPHYPNMTSTEIRPPDPL